MVPPRGDGGVGAEQGRRDVCEVGVGLDLLER